MAGNKAAHCDSDNYSPTHGHYTYKRKGVGSHVVNDGTSYVAVHHCRRLHQITAHNSRMKNVQFVLLPQQFGLIRSCHVIDRSQRGLGVNVSKVKGAETPPCGCNKEREASETESENLNNV